MPERRRILVVEDDARDLDLTLSALAQCGAAAVDVARSGAEALDRLTSSHLAGGGPALVLLDLKLPDVSGLELLSRFKRSGGADAVPVVMLTNSGDPLEVRRAYLAGASAYVIKPLSYRSLVETMAGVLSFWLGWNVLPPTGAGQAGLA